MREYCTSKRGKQEMLMELVDSREKSKSLKDAHLGLTF